MLLYNSLSKKKEEVHLLEKGKAKIYVCGITPYDTTHLGHAFLYVFFDAYIRFLRSQHIDVTNVQNVTDIDNDILIRAKRDNRDWKELGEEWTEKFLNDLKALNVEMPTHYVKATDSIEKIIEITKSLLEKNQAYENQGNVYFSTKTFTDYGKLSHFSEPQMELLAQERGGDPNDPLKKAPLDFLLWQKSRPEDDQLLANANKPFWTSPWGDGRPGWHIECSAMIHQYLGEQIDIHGGGRDLIFPHHESEIAQSESFTGKEPFVGYWMHAAMVMYQGEKMSKSLGNLILVSELLKKYSPNAIRWMLLSHHYRTPWEFSFEELDEAEEVVRGIEKELELRPNQENNVENTYLHQFISAMDSDADTPTALEIIKEATKNKEISAVFEMYKILGFSITYLLYSAYDYYL